MINKIAKTVIAVPFVLSAMGTAQALEFGVFSDITFSDSGVEGEDAGFALGALDFYGTAQIDENTRVFIEYVFENGSDGLITDLERLWVARTISDELTIGVGRFHSPLGYWNRTYHHGAILQDTVSRPFFLEFEDGAGAILPVHVVGLMATGDFALSSGYLEYEAYIANGPSIDTSVATAADREIEINDSGDNNASKSVGFRTTFTPNVSDMSVSLFVMSNVVSDSGGVVAGGMGQALVSETISGMDLAYRMDDFDLIVEYYNLSNKDEAGALGTQTGTAYYIQLGHQFADAWKLSVRHEAISTKEGGDRYFRELGIKDASHNVAAIRYDIDDTNALKFEVNQSNPEDGTEKESTAYMMQWSFLVP